MLCVESQARRARRVPPPTVRSLTLRTRMSMMVSERTSSARPNEMGSADLMPSALWSSRRFRTFNRLDDFIEIRGKSTQLRLDNGPELISDALAQCANKHRIALQIIRPGKPM